MSEDFSWEPQETAKKDKKPNNWVRSLALVIVIIVVIFVVTPLTIRTFFIQAFKTPAGSMKPTVLVGDYILVNKTVHGKQPSRNDIIVFKYPKDRNKNFIKRVVALPGETIEIRDKKIIINGVPQPDGPYVHIDKEILPPRDNYGPEKVPPGTCFVLGDNMDESLDSRFWGFVPFEDIRGRAFIIYFSWDSETETVRWDRVGKGISAGSNQL